ncbi:HPr(Ser) kinase/phosphatase [bacterium]|nr:HPr(Ser) kinase/phosphatase [bacterium]
MGRLTVHRLVEERGEELALLTVARGSESPAEITSCKVSKPGLLLAGYEEGFDSHRIQVLGGAEMAHLDTLDSPGRREALARLLRSEVPCVIVSDGREAPAELVELSNETGVPVLSCETGSTQLARELATAIDELLAPQDAVHGTLVDVYGVGLLFTGDSGIGKSECGLDLVANGHSLVADDVVNVTVTPQGHLIGTGSELLRHYMEIRGVGIIDVRSIYGIRAIRLSKLIEVEVRLVRWSELEDYERLGLDERMTRMLGVEIPFVMLTLVPGKNITVIAEVIALNHLLKLHGVHPAREFDRRLRDLASEKARVRKILRGGTE